MFCHPSSFLFPLLILWWIEINCRWWRRLHTDWDKNILLHKIGLSISSCDTQPSLPLLSHFPFPSPPFSTSFCSSLSSLPRALSRAVMGLDRESDVVHIETRIAKGRECFTPVHRSSKTHRTLCLSFRARSQGRWDLFCCSDWSLKSSKEQ